MSDAAVATIVTGVVTMATLICSVVTLYLRLKWTDKKIDDNTELTRANTVEAVVNAKIAADTATDAKIAAIEIADRLNGTMNEEIISVVKQHVDPILVAIKVHSEQDEKNMVEIRNALGELRDRTK